jgi:hypothetical protein
MAKAEAATSCRGILRLKTGVPRQIFGNENGFAAICGNQPTAELSQKTVRFHPAAEPRQL